jgi:hypothetical protein
MVDFVYERDPHRMYCLGMDLNRPIDKVTDLHWALLRNTRSYQAGRIETRLGLTSISAIGTNIHSIRRLNDPANTTWTRVVGDSVALYTGQAAFTQRDTGYSGNPLALVPHRPPQASASWMYIGDSSRMRKVNPSGTVHQIGMPPPTAEPTVALGTPKLKDIELGDSATGWTVAGDCSAIGAAASQRVDTTVTAVLYDTGTAGWCCVMPASLVNIGAGTRILCETGQPDAETFTVQAVYPGTTATTIAATNGITYDSGATGACSIVLTDWFDQVKPDALLYNSTVGAYSRILAVIEGPQNTKSIRCSTAATWAQGNAISLVDSFRAFTTSTVQATDTLDSVGLDITVSGNLDADAYAVKDIHTTPLDLSQIAAGVASSPDDYIHLSIKLSVPALLTEGRIMFDVTNQAAVADSFKSDYYYKTFTPNDLTANISATPITLTSTLQRAQQIQSAYQAAVSSTPAQAYQEAYNRLMTEGFPGMTSPTTTAEVEAILGPSPITPQMEAEYREAVDTIRQLDSGATWVEFRFKIGDMIRVGSNPNSSLKAVYYLRLQFAVADNSNTDWHIYFHSLHLSGGYGPDTGAVGQGYQYRYRARCTTTGAVSNWSPASRGPLMSYRQLTTVAAPAQYTTATEADVLEFQRYGGTLLEWHDCGTVANSAGPVTYSDVVDDAVIAVNPSTGQANYQLWPILGVPVSGTTSMVSGTTVTDAATGFSTAWAPGTRIEINNYVYTIFRVLSTSKLELVESAGAQGAVAWRVVEPVIQSTNLPCLWGPLDGILFGCGDTKNPQRLYFTNRNSESTLDTNYFDITTPSEPLMNGCVYNGRAYVFSTERAFQIIPTGNGWGYVEIPGCPGLWSRWGFDSCSRGPGIPFLSKDGIYVTDGGPAKSLTNDTLLPLFPNEGNLGTTTNTIVPPNLVAAQAAKMRLSWYDNYLYFDFIDTTSARKTLVYAFDLMDGRGGWVSVDDYTPDIAIHYGEEGDNVHSLLVGSTTGVLFQYAGVSDNGTAIACQIRTGARDQGDARLHKLYGDIMLDANTNSVNVTATPYFNNFATAGTAATVNTASRLQTPFNVSTAWYAARNIGLDLAWSSSNGGQQFFLWEPRWHEEGAPIIAYSWELPATNFGMNGYIYTGEMYLTHTSTANISLVFTVDNVAQPAITIAHGAGVELKSYIRLPVMKGKLIAIRISSATAFRVDGPTSELRVKQWGTEEAWRSVPMFADMAASESAA